jgi:uncharacterized protein YecT (DUF1311 family)
MRATHFLRCALPLLLISASAFAAPEKCSDMSNQGDMNACTAREYKAIDAKLNASYKALMAKISPAGQASLRNAQRTWVAYRDAECTFETMGTADGSIHPTVYASCLEGLTVAQTKNLDMQLHCVEGDLSCGGQ